MYIKSRNKIQILMHSYLKEEQLSHPDFQRELVVGVGLSDAEGPGPSRSPGIS